MDQDHAEYKKFLEEQIEWCTKRDRVLEEIETKLQQMKKIAEYAFKHELNW
jgi:hypothetical protein